MNITADQIATVIVAIITSSTISVIVSSLINRSKLTAEVQRLHSQAATDTIDNYGKLVKDQRVHIDELKARSEITDHSLALLPTLTARCTGLEAELKREKEQNSALRALTSQPNNSYDLIRPREQET